MRTSIAGLSLVELMVVLGIVGVLATLAFPRYRAFMVKARRGEAKSNLSHIASLQSTYKIDYFAYYNADPLSVNGIGYKDGKGMEGQNDCDADKEVDKGTCNHLGFDPEGLSELRYLYQVRDSGSTVVASAASDGERKWIYPDCSGVHTNEECGYRSGDAVILAVNNRQSTVCRNITKYCPLGTSGFTPVVVSTPPPPPPSCASTQCCDGTTVMPNTTGLTCTGGWYGTYNPSDPFTYGCCHTTPPPPPTCQDTIQCCVNPTTEKLQPTTLACDSWYGTWSSSANDEGCCKCNPGKTFGFDNGHGSCCPNSNPVYTYTSAGQGFCCPPGMYYSYDDSGSNIGKCCATGRSYSHDTVSNTGGCCSQGAYWDGTKCVAGCGSGLCCNDGVAMTNAHCKNIHGQSFKLNFSTCDCEPCTKEDACGYYPYGDWVNGKCKKDPNFMPSMSNPMFVQDPYNYCSGEFRSGCDGTTHCCTDEYTIKTCPVGRKLKNPPRLNNPPYDCECVECKKRDACINFSHNSIDAQWSGGLNVGTCTHGSYDPNDYVFVQKAHDRCAGQFVRKCTLSSDRCCNGNHFITPSSCNRLTEKWVPSADLSIGGGCCRTCTKEDACKNAHGRWKDVGASIYDCKWWSQSYEDRFNWVYTSPNCHGRFERICDTSNECCNDGCPPGEKMTAHPSCCVACIEEDACKSAGGEWRNGTCTHRYYTNDANKDNYKWVHNTINPCGGGFKRICKAPRCCDGDILKTCSFGHKLNTSTCDCDGCSEEIACESSPAYGTWNDDGTCTPPPGSTGSNHVFVQDPSDPCRGQFKSGCADNECCNDGRTKTDDDCDTGKTVAPHPDCRCMPCSPADACEKSGFTWDPDNNKCTRTASPGGEFVQYSHDSCRGYFLEPCTTCKPQTQCCVSNSLEVPTAEDAHKNITCDEWAGHWNSSADNKGCCICNNGRTFSYDISSESGACCPAGQSWDGTACK